MSPPPRIRQRLTGRARVRCGRFGRSVVQVEVEHTSWEPFRPDKRRERQVGPDEWEVIPPWHEWRDAKRDELICGATFEIPVVVP